MLLNRFQGVNHAWPLPISVTANRRHGRYPLSLPCTRPIKSSVRGHKALRVMSLDAAMPFDFEHKAKVRMEEQQKLTIGLVGFGTFGQFLAKRLVSHGHQIIATSRTPYVDAARKLGVEFYSDPDDFCEAHPDVVLLSTSILSLEDVLSSLPVQRLRRSTLFVDVLSVKVFPKRLMLDLLPPEVDILCTHPMFGPDSGRGSWEGLNFMYEKVRVGSSDNRRNRVDTFLNVFRDEGCRMVELSCEDHDRQAASTQFITHTVGRMLGQMQLQSTEIDTKGFQSLLSLVDNTTNDSFDLYYGLFLYNQNATEELFRLETAFDDVKRQLFDRVHGILRQQLFRQEQAAAMTSSSPSVSSQQQDQAGAPAIPTSVSSDGTSVSTGSPAAAEAPQNGSSPSGKTPAGA